MIDLNTDEKVWLRQHGGRTRDDVFLDSNGKYVLMGDGEGGYKRVYIPEIL